MKILSIFRSKNLFSLTLATATLSLMSIPGAIAGTLNLSLTKLSGLTGGNSATTAVYRADLSNIGFDINSILIADSNSGFGGASGKFSGFDLDGIKLSNTLISNAADINSLPSLNVFDFTSGKTFFTPGIQRQTANSALFGTSQGNIDNLVATLQQFDANSVADETAFGLVSLGDGGKVEFKLKNAVSTASPLYLYIGEAGDNGEVASSQIAVSDISVKVPEASNLAALSLMGIYFLIRSQKKNKIA